MIDIKFNKNLISFSFIAILGSFIAVILMPYSRDYQTYLELFDSYANAPDLISSVQTSELTYSIMAYLTKSFIITSFLLGIVALSIKMFFFAKYNNLAFVGMAYYFARFFIVHDVTQIRISFAIGMLLVAYNNLKKSKYWLGLFFLLFAIASHTSTLIYVPVILLASLIKKPEIFLRKSIKYCLYTIAIVLPLSNLLLARIPIVEIVSNLPDIRLYNYITEEYDFVVPKLSTDVFFFLKIIALIVLVYWKKPNELEDYQEYSRCGIVFLFSLVFFVVFHDLFAIASRLSDIAAPFECIVMSLFIKRISQPTDSMFSPFGSFVIKIVITSIILFRLIVAQAYLL